MLKGLASSKLSGQRPLSQLKLVLPTPTFLGVWNLLSLLLLLFKKILYFFFLRGWKLTF